MSSFNFRKSSFRYYPKSGICCRRLDFLGFIGYRVGDDGSVWTRLKRKGLGMRHGTKTVIAGEWIKLTARPNQYGYVVNLLTDASGKKRRCPVHRIVLLAFCGSCPASHETRHFPDRTKSNNRLENLSWATPKTNNGDKRIHGTLRNQYKPQHGEKNGNTSLTNDQVRKIKALHASKTMKNVEIMRLFKISQAIFYSMIGGRTWRSVV